jgi:hypothetical protein
VQEQESGARCICKEVIIYRATDTSAGLAQLASERRRCSGTSPSVMLKGKFPGPFVGNVPPSPHQLYILNDISRQSHSFSLPVYFASLLPTLFVLLFAFLLAEWALCHVLSSLILLLLERSIFSFPHRLYFNPVSFRVALVSLFLYVSFLVPRKWLLPILSSA